MSALKATSVWMSILGVLLTAIALGFGLQTLTRSDNTGIGVTSLGFALQGGICFLAAAISAMVQPFARRKHEEK